MFYAVLILGQLLYNPRRMVISLITVKVRFIIDCPYLAPCYSSMWEKQQRFKENRTVLYMRYAFSFKMYKGKLQFEG